MYNASTLSQTWLVLDDFGTSLTPPDDDITTETTSISNFRCISELEVDRGKIVTLNLQNVTITTDIYGYESLISDLTSSPAGFLPKPDTTLTDIFVDTSYAEVDVAVPTCDYNLFCCSPLDISPDTVVHDQCRNPMLKCFYHRLIHCEIESDSNAEGSTCHCTEDKTTQTGMHIIISCLFVSP